MYRERDIEREMLQYRKTTPGEVLAHEEVAALGRSLVEAHGLISVSIIIIHRNC